MAKKVHKMPAKLRSFLDTIMMDNEEIRCTFRESFRWDASWDSLLPTWLVLTNLRLLILDRALPGIRMNEFHIRGMDINMFQDNVGVYDSIEFRLNDMPLHQVAVLRTRREEAKEFVREATENIAKIDFGPSPLVKIEKTQSKACDLDKRHLKDLERMGAITEHEYEEEADKPCEK